MTDHNVSMINIALESYGMIISASLALFMIFDKSARTRLGRCFTILLIADFFVLMSDMITWVFSAPLSQNVTLSRVFNFFVYSGGFVLIALFSTYLFLYVCEKTKPSPIPLYIILFVCTVSVLLIVVSQFNSMFYYFDSNNAYHRGELFWLTQVISVGLMLFDSVLLFIFRKHYSFKSWISFQAYVLIMLTALIIQIFFYGITLIYVGTTISFFILFINIQIDRDREREIELSESRMKLMLSQIQPHFLYNALSVIKGLYQTDSQKGEHALDSFSDYLRGNIDSISAAELVSFRKELNHTKKYLELEKHRFSDRLKVVYILNTLDFLIPPLTLEPIVENAVRHGIMQKSEGGTLTICTDETDSEYIITVTDDGVGFDTNKIDGISAKSHIGISNARERLEMLCKASLEIHSVIGKGTQAVVRIRKQ